MAERATRQLLDAIGAFRDAYRDDTKFKDLLARLDTAEQDAEKLVPGAYDRTPDEADRPRNLKDAGNRARQEIRKARQDDAEDAKDGGRDEDKESS